MTTHRTIYCWSRLWDYTAIPLQQSNTISEMIMERKHGWIRLQDVDILPEDAPPGLEMWRPSSALPVADKFSDVVLKRTVREDDNLPDILPVGGTTFVSEACRDAFLACDPDGGHEFLPTFFLDADARKLGAQDYFRWWPGRIANVKQAGPRDYRVSNDWSSRSEAERQFGNRAQAMCLSHVPIWTSQTLKDVFFSQEVFAKLKTFSLIGLEEFTRKGGQKPTTPDGFILYPIEFVSHVHVPLMVEA